MSNSWAPNFVVCQSCSGTGKAIAGLQGNGVIIKDCNHCTGAGRVYKAPPAPTPEGIQMAGKEKTAQASEILPKAKTLGDVTKGVAGQVATAFIQAGKQKVAAEAMNGIVAATKGLLGDKYPDHPLADKAVAIGMPILLMLATQALGEQKESVIPKALLDNINAAATYALQGVSKETVDELAAVALPFALQIAAVGMQAMKLNAGSGQYVLPDGKMNEDPE